MHYDSYHSDYNFRPQTDPLARQRFLSGTYGIMALGLLITFAMAWIVARFFPQVIYNRFTVLLLLFAQLGTVWSFTRRLGHASYQATVGMFIFYAALTGLTMSSIFLLFDLSAISLCFVASAVSFCTMAVLGYTAKQDLSPMRPILFGGLIGLLVMSLIGIFLHLPRFQTLLSCFGIVLFLGLTAYDTQKLNQMYYSVAGTAMEQKYAVFGALQLYLDFINLFQYMLMLFGGRDNR